MKCPHCNYAHGFYWDGDDPVDICGDEGEFYRLPIGVERERRFSYNPEPERETLYACPKCGKTFIDI